MISNPSGLLAGAFFGLMPAKNPTVSPPLSPRALKCTCVAPDATLRPGCDPQLLAGYCQKTPPHIMPPVAHMLNVTTWQNPRPPGARLPPHVVSSPSNAGVIVALPLRASSMYPLGAKKLSTMTGSGCV